MKQWHDAYNEIDNLFNSRHPVVEPELSQGAADNFSSNKSMADLEPDLRRAKQLNDATSSANERGELNGNFGTQVVVSQTQTTGVILFLQTNDKEAETLTVVLAPLQFDNVAHDAGGIHQAIVEFGAGGVQQTVKIDYPESGAVFQVHGSWVRVTGFFGFNFINPPPSGWNSLQVTMAGFATKGADPKPQGEILFTAGAGRDAVLGVANGATFGPFNVPAEANGCRVNWDVASGTGSVTLEYLDGAGNVSSVIILTDSTGSTVVPMFGGAVQWQIINNTGSTIRKFNISFTIKL